MKSAIVEQVIRTLKEKLFKYFNLSGTDKWIAILPGIIKNYTSQKHRTIKMRLCNLSKRNERKEFKLKEMLKLKKILKE